ncbi:sensor histidine kinase [Sphingomonas hengshuiensis]|uniref:Histidine kinase/HSP90-like ATPase domain-containing protein n=1 Tax=Sphingomonas hengshuiensis TaxID=1609977 RepID=A0A7U4JAS0_9SPHN|nr:two-component regulator propeller domain-containing protein [Sphingomonas hengshuiensis]AJP73384.1 hypothetical protein TS85_18665 [Sphingomonas hengshuiensis]
MTLRAALAALAAGLAGLLLAGAARAGSVPLVEYKHVGWSMEDGAPNRINSIAQTTNGYLWLGGVEGLFRFDGVTFEPIRQTGPDGERMVVSAVLGARNGDLWVGLARGAGVLVYRGGRLLDPRMPDPSREVTDLAEDRDGALWVARGGRSRNTLARYWRGHWEEIGADWGLPEQPVWQMLFGRDGTMWVVLNDTVVRRRPGARRFEPTGERVLRRAALAEDAQGRIWVSDGSGTRTLRSGPDARWLTRRYDHDAEVGGSRMVFDRRGDLWSTTWTDGIFQIAAPGSAPGDGGRIATFRASDGLSSDQTHAVFEDREGNMWIGTELGLDMLRPASVIVETGIPANSARGYRIASTADGSVYVSDTGNLYRIAPGGRPQRILRTAPNTPGTLCAAQDGGVWLSLRDEVIRVGPDGRRTRTLPKPGGASGYGCAEDRLGRLWFTGLDKGLFWHAGGGWHRWPGLSSADGLPANAAIDASGVAAILFRAPAPMPVQTPFMPLMRERFGIGGLEGVLPGQAALYVGAAQGMARIANGRVQLVRADRYPLLASINGLVQTPAGETWTIGDSGILRIATATLDRAFATPGAPLPLQRFDFRDGMNSFVQKSSVGQAAGGGDGRLWFLARRNVLRIDPSRLARNTLPPPVAIRAVTVGATRYRDPTAITVPAGTTSLTIAYTALSLSVPSRVAFRYRLEGIDKGWIDPGARREAVYSGMGPGSFRFQVIAANDDGVWNPTGATVTVTIPPTFFQTWLFRAACLIGFALILWALYSLRLRHLADQIRGKLEVRVAERERIARELHDTLLQSVQGLMLRFQSVADHIADEHPAKPVIDRALERADQMLVEGRDRVRDLRAADRRSLEVILDEVAREQPFSSATTVAITSEGTPRPIQPLILDEIVRIAGEALFNAALHARANHVQVGIAYGRTRLSVSFRDDGVGIDAERLVRAGREGHFGLIGMHERARKVGATLTLDSTAEFGTTVTFSLPAAVAYLPAPRRSWTARFWRRRPNGATTG